MRVFAVDLGGTHATCALIEDRTVLHKERLQLPNTERLQPILPALEEILKRFVLQSTGPIAGIGFGIPTLIDSRANKVTSTNGKFVDTVDIDLPRWSMEKFKLPLRLENDARMALLGECYAGAAKGETDVVMFTLGTGIGGAAMMDGQLLQGKHGQAGVLGGHVPIRLDGRRCNCGAIGCAESEASGWALSFVCEEWPHFNMSKLASCSLNFENLFACSTAGDRVAQEIQKYCLKVWAATAVSAIYAFDPELILFGGGIMKSGELILPYIQQYIARYAMTPWGQVRVEAAQLGDDAPLLGAGSLFQGEL
jgi:glucokinase